MNTRTLVDLRGTHDGPTVVVTGAIHGNEPSGTHAVRRVAEQLRARGTDLHGRLVGLVGNLRASREGRRYIDRDLNRGWSPEALGRLGRLDPDPRESSENQEQRELLGVMAPILRDASEPVVFVDLHTTSGDGGAFIAMADVLRNRPIADAVPLPLVLGLEEVIEATMLGYLCDLGHVGVAVEGGQHDDPAAVDRHEATIWLILLKVGMISHADVPDLAKHERRIRSATREIPRVLDIRHRHVVAPEDGFVMRPGYLNFQPIRRGEQVAGDQRGTIEAPVEGLMMMPRYQGQGEDGYFVARAVSPLWLRLSAGLRHLRLEGLLGLWPGLHHDAEQDALVWRGDQAPHLLTDVMHLFGYRRRVEAGQAVIYSRRRPDHVKALGLPPELQPFADPVESRGHRKGGAYTPAADEAPAGA